MYVCVYVCMPVCVYVCDCVCVSQTTLHLCNGNGLLASFLLRWLARIYKKHKNTTHTTLLVYCHHSLSIQQYTYIRNITCTVCV